MRMLSIAVRFGDGASMNKESADLRNEGYDIMVEQCDSAELDTDPLKLSKMLDSLASTDFVLMRAKGDMSLFNKFDVVLRRIVEVGTSAFIYCSLPEPMGELRHLFRQRDQDYELLKKYVLLGGYANNMGILKWVLRTIGGQTVEVPDPTVYPAQGVYCPGQRTYDIEDYISGIDRSRPTVGIFISQRRWRSENLGPIDELIREIEKKEANVLPIFFSYSENRCTGSIGIKGIVDRYLSGKESIIDVVINTISSSVVNESKLHSEDEVPDDMFLERLGVPILQTPTLVKTEQEWRSDIYGLTNAEIAYDVALPEFDGQIITVPHAGTDKGSQGSPRFTAIRSRIPDIADMAVMWAKLHRKKNSEKRVAIILYMYPPSSVHAGGAAGLDTFQSVLNMLARMKSDGYRIDWMPENSKELVDRILAGVTNDTQWISSPEIKRRAVDMIGLDQYNEWFSCISEGQRRSIESNWGPAPGNIHTVEEDIIVPGIMNGNVLISFQPDRGKDIQADYHNHECAIPHQYLAFYKWLRYDFGADAVVHVGTHGTLEWLPGKSVALSEECSPDYVLSGLPNIYPYVICNPGEGVQAKRRSCAVLIDHMIPAMGRAGSYDELAELEAALQNYMRTEAMKQPEQLAIMRDEIYAIVKRLELLSDMGLPPDATPAEVGARADELYDYVLEIKGNLIKDGLHVFGQVPERERLDEMIYSLTRLNNGDIPSLPMSIAKTKGLDYRYLSSNCSEHNEAHKKYNGELVDLVENETMEIIGLLTSFRCEKERCVEEVSKRYPGENADLLRVVSFICDELYGNIMKISMEIDNFMVGLSGGYVLPGPSGCPTRGRAQILPTGRNFYTIDPESIPGQASWEIGKRMADQMVQRYLEEKGEYPTSISIVVWATDVMKTGGDDIAYILWLMGVRPVWAGYGNRVIDMEVIPIKELGRPRIDVTIRISGLFRDAFPNLTDLFDRAIKLVADLEEEDNENYIKANVKRDIVEELRSGVPEEEAKRRSTVRIFSAAPGHYGTGINVLIRSSKWTDRNELGVYYQQVGCHAYGGDRRGEPDETALKRRLRDTKVTIKNSASREYDLFDNDDVFQYLGGLNSAVESLTGEIPMSVIGCSADVSNPTLKTVQEEARYVFRSKVLNPKYVEGLKRHGFRGAEEIAKMFEYIFAWDATSDIVEKWMYDFMTDRYIFNDDVRDWIEENNPYAMREMVGRLLEAVERNMWEPSEETLERLRDIYLENENALERLNDAVSSPNLNSGGFEREIGGDDGSP